MGIIESILLGESQITFTLSFIINLVLLAAIYWHYRPIETECKNLKEKLNEKDEVIQKQAEENKVLTDEVYHKVSLLAADTQTGVDRINQELDKISKVGEDVTDIKESTKEISSEMRILQSGVDNVNNKQSLLHGVLLGQSLLDDSITKVK